MSLMKFYILFYSIADFKEVSQCFAALIFTVEAAF